MTVCGQCGSASDGRGSAFCGACGGFLEFVGVARAPEPAPVPPPVAPASPAVPAPRQGDAALLVTGVGAVLPGAEADRRAVRRVEEPTAPGDLPCPACRTGNAAGRAFCRRCGALLSSAAAADEPGWWRRLWTAVHERCRALRSRTRSREAGERPRRWDRPEAAGRRRRSPLAELRQVSLPMHAVTPVLLVLCLLGVSVPSLRSAALGAVQAATVQVRRLVAPQLVPVRPVAVSASSAVPGHEAGRAVDGVTTTSWAEAAPGDGAGQVLVLEYDRPVDLRRLGVRVGAAGPPEAYASQPRPERVLLVAGDQQQELVLRDTVDLQDLDVDLDDVERLELRVLSVYGGQLGSAASITEVTAFTVR